MKVQDIKPSVQVVEAKPNLGAVVDHKTNMSNVNPLNERYYSVTTSAGQAMGLLLALTYKEGFTVMSSKST